MTSEPILSRPASGLPDYRPLANHRRILLLTDGHSTPFLAKTAISLLRYRGPDIAGVWESSAVGKSAAELFAVGDQVPVVDQFDHVESPDAVYVGIAPPGGKLPEHWKPILLKALHRGMDVVSGLHDFLADDPELVAESRRGGGVLIDVRRNRFKETPLDQPLPERPLRIHTVGHDCSVGKMVASMEIQRELTRRGHTARFLATGQTGIMISGAGVPIDCVIADFVNGAADHLVRQHSDADYLVIEGQGSISHPAFSAVTAGLLHGCAPHALVFVYQAGRTHVKGMDRFPIPPLEQQIEALKQLAALRLAAPLIGVAVNTRELDDQQATREVQAAAERFQLPACDVFRDGPSALADAVLAFAASHQAG